jgi:lipid-A-disaccharide synthase-like uncharacterized protein
LRLGNDGEETRMNLFSFNSLKLMWDWHAISLSAPAIHLLRYYVSSLRSTTARKIYSALQMVCTMYYVCTMYCVVCTMYYIRSQDQLRTVLSLLLLSPLLT